MQIPTDLTVVKFYNERHRYLQEECYSNPATGVVLCRNCGSRIKIEPLELEVRDLGELEQGAVEHLIYAGVPYCPQCEAKPGTQARVVM